MTQDEIIELADKALENAEYGDYGNKELNKAITAIKEALAQPEPVAWWNDTGTHIDLNVSGRGTPLYTTPPQRTWVGLTDEELSILVESFTHPDEGIDEVDFGMEIQRILKEKNT